MNERVIYPSSVLEGFEKDIVNSTHAGFGIRLVAFIFDLLIISSLKGIITGPLIKFAHLEDVKFMIPLFSAENILNGLIYFLYFILLTWFFKATLGKMMLGLKVVSYDRSPLTFFKVVTRELFGRYISNAFLGLPYLVVLFNGTKQGVHDILSDTIVIKEDKERLRDKLVQPVINQNNSHLL